MLKNSRLIWKIMKMNHMEGVLITYLIWILAACFILMFTEPDIRTFGDAVWYCFALVTSTGFGDLNAVTPVGRTVSVILGIYSIFVIALLTAVVIDFYQEKLRIRQNESVLLFLDKMEHLPELSREELADMSERVKKIKWK